MGPRSQQKQSRRAKKQNIRSRFASENIVTRRNQATIVSADNTKTGFADLAPELRNLIYEYALCPPDSKALRLNAGSGAGAEIAVHLLSTCQRIRNEATSILYRGNAFRIDLLRINMSTLMDVVGEHDCGAACPQKQRFQRLYMLFDCPLMKELSRPGLCRTLDQFLPAKRLGMIKSFVFCYHMKSDLSREDALNPGPDLLSGEPSVLIYLDFVKKAPYYRIKVDAPNREESIVEKERWYMDHISEFMKDTITCRCLRSLAKKDVLEFSEWIQQQCRHIIEVAPQ